jgi:DNA repair protein RadC
MTSGTVYNGFKEIQLVVRDNPSLPVEFGPLVGKQFITPKSVYEAVGLLNDLSTESLLVLHLDNKARALALQVVSIGSINASIVHPREVFRAAILQGSARIIAIHNHPSGDPEPSNEDRDITQRLRETGRVIGIPLCDHIVVGKDSYYSFADHGW